MSSLEPGSYRASTLTDEAALVQALLRTEVAWLYALAAAGILKPEQVAAAEQSIAAVSLRLDAHAVEGAGNPVPALLDIVRAAVEDPDVADLVHKGLTSQDTLDTALMLIAGDVLDRVGSALKETASKLARLADDHRTSVMAGRTLTQHAVPVTFGLKAAQWLVGVVDAADAVAAVGRALPVQCGGAAGTLSLAGDLVSDPTQLAADFAQRLGLTWPGLPWHTRRTPITRLGDVLVEVLDALGKVATDVLVLGRPEIAEVREGLADGRGGSSTMPHKRNPVLAVLVHSAALQAPQLAAQLHLCAAHSIDERSDGAWHAEWPALQRLMSLAVVATAQAAELVLSLEVDVGVMRRRVRDSSTDLLAERRRQDPGDAASHLGAAHAFIDAALHRFRERSAGDG
ncbi:MAG: lyase family protein [Candidatus Nanopelagicales bacterium]